MLELLDPPDPGRRDREVVRAAGEPLLLCQRVSKWYGPVIGINQVTLELRPGITGLVGHNGCGKRIWLLSSQS